MFAQDLFFYTHDVLQSITLLYHSCLENQFILSWKWPIKHELGMRMH